MILGMFWGTIIYPFILALLYLAVYLVVFFLFPKVFNYPHPAVTRQVIVSALLVMALSLLTWAVTTVIPNEQLANRLLHAVGGGVLVMVTCFLAARESQAKINTFQFIVFSVLVTTALGVGNEILEFFLQNVTGEMFADSIIDTWLDLTSNTVRALVAAVILIPLWNKNRE